MVRGRGVGHGRILLQIEWDGRLSHGCRTAASGAPVSFGHGPLRHLSELRQADAERATCTVPTAAPSCRRRSSTAARSSSSCTRASTQAAAFEVYRTEAARLAAAGWYPIAHSWGDERPGAGSAATGAGAQLSGTLMVTYRQEGHA